MSLAELRASLTAAKLKRARERARVAYRRRKHRWYHSRSRRPRRERERLATKWHHRVEQAEERLAKTEALVRRRERQIAARAPSKRRRAVANALRHVGVRETFRNGGGIISTWQRKLGFGNVAWCGIFVGNMLIEAGVRGVTSRIASVALIEADAKAGRGPFRAWSWGTRNAQPGDLACIGAEGQHVEEVVSRLSDGSLITVGGNVSDRVMRMHRPAHQVRGIAHIRA